MENVTQMEKLLIRKEGNLTHGQKTHQITVKRLTNQISEKLKSKTKKRTMILNQMMLHPSLVTKTNQRKGYKKMQKNPI